MATSTVSPNPSTNNGASAPSPAKVKNPKRRKRLIVAAVLLVLALAAAAATYYLTDYFKPKTAVAVAPVPSADPIYVALAPMTVNLQPNDTHKFLHAGVTLKVADAKAQVLVNQYLPEVTSRVLLVLSNRRSDTLITPEDKAKLAAEALSALTLPFGPNLPAAKISGVMFPVFMLQ
ncbi:MAG: flagellar basal body-associated FliL family protein [Comamonadaceae bacterium]